MAIPFAKSEVMTKIEAIEMAKNLLAAHGNSGFDISMPTQEAYDLMLRTFEELGRSAGQDGEFLMVRVAPASPTV
jgi:hypothetical protein